MPDRILADPGDLRDINLASGISLAVGIYSILIAAGAFLQPAQYWSSASLMGYVLIHWGWWTVAAPHLVLGAALILATLKEERLLAALVVTTLIFVFWALGPLVAARFGALPYPSVTALLNYSWFAALSGFALYKTIRLRIRAGTMRVERVV